MNKTDAKQAIIDRITDWNNSRTRSNSATNQTAYGYGLISGMTSAFRSAGILTPDETREMQLEILDLDLI